MPSNGGLDPGPAADLDQDRLQAHQQVGFARTLEIDDSIATSAVQAFHRGPRYANSPILKFRIRDNLIRLFQLAVHFDDFLSLEEDDLPDDNLMNIIERLWDIQTPAPLGPAVMRDILKHWYERHVKWWQATHKSKRRFEQGRDLVLVSVMDEYRQTRRYRVPRREREGHQDNLAPDFRMVALVLNPAYLASRVLQWRQLMANLPDLIYCRALPCPPIMDNAMQAVFDAEGVAFMEASTKVLVEMRGDDDAYKNLAHIIRTGYDWALKAMDQPMPEQYRVLDPALVDEFHAEIANFTQAHWGCLPAKETKLPTPVPEQGEKTERGQARSERGCSDVHNQYEENEGDILSQHYDASGEDEDVTEGNGYWSDDESELSDPPTELETEDEETEGRMYSDEEEKQEGEVEGLPDEAIEVMEEDEAEYDSDEDYAEH